MNALHLPPDHNDYQKNKGMSRVQVSDTDRSAEAGAESSRQVTAREARNTPQHCAQCKAYRLGVGKGECGGVRLDSSERDDTVLLSEGPCSEAERNLGVALGHLLDGAWQPTQRCGQFFTRKTMTKIKTLNHRCQIRPPRDIGAVFQSTHQNVQHRSD